MISVAKPLIDEADIEAVTKVLQSGNLAQGPEVAAFESEFGEWVDGLRCVAVNSGTSALHLALLAAGVRRGDEVIVPSFTFAATANAVALAGGTPVFADISLDDYCIDPVHVEQLITDRTRAIIPVHLYGHPAKMHSLSEIATRKGISIVEDAAQAHGAAIDGRRVGTFGVAGIFSFYPTKNMTSGEGGMITTACPHIERQLRVLRNQGMERRYANEMIGFNLRMTDIHAALGRSQLKRLEDWTRKRQQNAEFYGGNLRGVEVPTTRPGCTHVFHQYTIRLPEGTDRESVMSRLREFGVDSGVYYPTPVHELPSYGKSLDLDNTRRAARTVLSLPVHPSLTADDLEKVVTSVNGIFA